MKRFFLLMLIACMSCFWGCAAGGDSSGKPAASQCSKTRFLSVGTGDITGIYYPAGGAISKIVNKNRRRHCLRLVVGSTLGSVYNINEIVSGDFEFGLVQSDRQYQAWHGLREWADKGPQKDLRAVFSLHPETVNLIAAVDSGIRDIRDLKGKRVNIGNIGSGQRQNSIDALSAAGLDYQKDIHAMSEIASKAPDMIQRGIIDAFFYTVGHPNAALKEATVGNRKVRFVPLQNIETILDRNQNAYYTREIIPVDMYPQAANSKDIETFGVRATFLTTSLVDDESVYAVTREVFNNLRELKSLHPALSRLDKKEMLKGMTVPFHPGAIRYYKEAGLWPPSE